MPPSPSAPKKSGFLLAIMARPIRISASLAVSRSPAVFLRSCNSARYCSRPRAPEVSLAPLVPVGGAGGASGSVTVDGAGVVVEAGAGGAFSSSPTSDDAVRPRPVLTTAPSPLVAKPFAASDIFGTTIQPSPFGSFMAAPPRRLASFSAHSLLL